MNRLQDTGVADLMLSLSWTSESARHTENYNARGVSLYKDWLPAGIPAELAGRRAGDRVTMNFEPGRLTGNGSQAGPRRLRTRQFDRGHFPERNVAPRDGRFYPQGMLRDVTGVFRQNILPFRCLTVENGHLDVDLGSPLASRGLELTLTVGGVDESTSTRGGTSIDWLGRLMEGAGMQARWGRKPTDFFSDDPFRRRDERPDGAFYGNPRMVHHLDETARGVVGDIYRRFLDDGMAVLDLMSSWESHLPRDIRLKEVRGLGMNADELGRNQRLDRRTVHDLNADPLLPFDDRAFDAVVCTASVEYLVRPMEVFAEVSRVLRPGGTFALTFSNRWFPPKAIRIWEEIHEHERMGLVLEYFDRSGGFDSLGTYTLRGLPRPRADRYASQTPYSDPVYAVWGTRKQKGD